jgi:hypothetical protein
VCDDGNLCTDDSCDSQTGCVFAPNTVPCDDGSVCTAGDVCGNGSCQPGAPTVVCNDGNVCTDDVCDPLTGSCVFADNTAACDDGNPCTAGDACGGGTCQIGVPITPPEASGLVAAADKTTFSWATTLYASQYDAVRGLVGSLPVGPGGGDEVCFADLGGVALGDAAVPPPGAAFWYVVRGENACFVGTYGTQSNGTPRVTTACP